VLNEEVVSVSEFKFSINNFIKFYFLVLHPVARNTTIFNESTSVPNQIMRVLFITAYTRWPAYRPKHVLLCKL
jgi:hypothetical protein